ncbi:MAG: DUF2207 domain-containing protein [Clostridia bacterium]|nr:DUF2207 domain-containing protein [Clostridia bacterium]
MKKIVVMFLMMIMIFSTTVNANSIDSITMDIYIDESGDAEITEVWKCYTNQGTESYHPYYNLGRSDIKNLRVSDEDGTTYTTLSSWNTNGTLESKKNKCGLNYISDGVEICWGISEYGSKTYTVQYEITNFVIELNDSQMIYWTLIPHDFSNRIENVEITIHADDRFEDSLDVWGYGDYGAPTYVYDGEIKMHSNGAINSNEYMVILVKFPSNTFDTAVKENKDFNYYYEMAEDGAIHYSNDNSSNTEIFVGLIIVFIYFFSFVIVFNTNQKVRLTMDQIRQVRHTDTYYRELPCEGDFFKIFYLADLADISNNKTDFLGALILKWVKEGKAKINKVEKNGLFSKEESTISLNRNSMLEINNFYEKQMYQLMYYASKDGVLEKKELEKWCNRKYNKLLNWFEKAIKEEKEKLTQKDELRIEKFGGLFKKKQYVLADNSFQETLNIAGLEKYLKDYTLINEREPIEVKLFEDYLIFAQIVGIADKVAKDFKDLYPEIMEISAFESFEEIDYIRIVTDTGVRTAKTAKSRAESYSSGGGGFSSGGGGGGSFGGGGGGRRIPLICDSVERMIKGAKKNSAYA